jgi:hypothetical protein
MAQVTGFPDYGRLAVQSAAVLANVATAFSLNPTTGVLDCTGYGYLDVYVNYGLVTSYAKIVAIWYLDPAATIIIGQNTILPVPGFESIKQWPVRSRYCQIFAVFESGIDTEIAVYNVFGNNAYMPGIRMDGNGYPSAYYAANVLAHQTIHAPLLQTYEGEAVFAGTTVTGSAYLAQLDFYQYDIPQWQSFAFVSGVTDGPSFIKTVRLPPAPVRITYSNQDTVTRFAVLSLVI